MLRLESPTSPIWSIWASKHSEGTPLANKETCSVPCLNVPRALFERCRKVLWGAGGSPRALWVPGCWPLAQGHLTWWCLPGTALAAKLAPIWTKAMWQPCGSWSSFRFWDHGQQTLWETPTTGDLNVAKLAIVVLPLTPLTLMKRQKVRRLTPKHCNVRRHRITQRKPQHLEELRGSALK